MVMVHTREFTVQTNYPRQRKRSMWTRVRVWEVISYWAYKADTEVQGRLQSEMETIRSLCVTQDEDSVLWKKALEMKVPSIWSGVQWLGSTKSVFPTMSVPDLAIGTTLSVDWLSLLTRWRN